MIKDIRAILNGPNNKLNCIWELPICDTNELNESQVDIKMKGLKCMRDDGNSKEVILASIRYFICHMWLFND